MRSAPDHDRFWSPDRVLSSKIDWPRVVAGYAGNVELAPKTFGEVKPRKALLLAGSLMRLLDRPTRA